jgi:hypothetical protein
MRYCTIRSSKLNRRVSWRLCICMYLSPSLKNRRSFFSLPNWETIYRVRCLNEMSFRCRINTKRAASNFINSCFSTLFSIHSVLSPAGPHFAIVPCMNTQRQINLHDVKCNKEAKPFPVIAYVLYSFISSYSVLTFIFLLCTKTSKETILICGYSFLRICNIYAHC